MLDVIQESIEFVSGKGFGKTVSMYAYREQLFLHMSNAYLVLAYLCLIWDYLRAELAESIPSILLCQAIQKHPVSPLPLVKAR
jgi:hypothetical protein